MLAKAAPETLCIMRLSALGDVCHALPVVRTLQTHFPHTRITWIIGRLEAGLLGDIPDIEFIIFDKARGLGAYTELRRALKGRSFDMLLHMQMSLRASIASRCLDARIRLGFDRRRARDCQWLFTNRRIVWQPNQHVMDSFFGFAEALGVGERVLRWDIPWRAADRDFAAHYIPARQATLIISPCANARFRNWRSWRAERYAEVADYAARHFAMRVILTGGPSETERAAGAEIVKLARTTPLNLIGRTSMKQLLALLARAMVLISPDSGPAHMATAVDLPVIGLYAATNPDRAGPYFSQRWRINRYPQALWKFSHTTPEQVAWGRRVRNPEAMDLITVHDVIAKLDQFMHFPGAARRLDPPSGGGAR
jgi:heptosyltransferase I